MKKKINTTAYYICKDGSKGFDDIKFEIVVPKKLSVGNFRYKLSTKVGKPLVKGIVYATIVSLFAVPAAIVATGAEKSIPEKYGKTRMIAKKGCVGVYSIGSSIIASVESEKVVNRVYSSKTYEDLENLHNNYDSHIATHKYELLKKYYDTKLGEGNYYMVSKEVYDTFDSNETVSQLFDWIHDMKTMKIEEDKGGHNDNEDA